MHFLYIASVGGPLGQQTPIEQADRQPTKAFEATQHQPELNPTTKDHERQVRLTLTHSSTPVSVTADVVSVVVSDGAIVCLLRRCKSKLKLSRWLCRKVVDHNRKGYD
jgi:hypothetical protein